MWMREVYGLAANADFEKSKRIWISPRRDDNDDNDKVYISSREHVCNVCMWLVFRESYES